MTRRFSFLVFGLVACTDVEEPSLRPPTPEVRPEPTLAEPAPAAFEQYELEIGAKPARQGKRQRLLINRLAGPLRKIRKMTLLGREVLFDGEDTSPTHLFDFPIDVMTETGPADAVLEFEDGGTHTISNAVNILEREEVFLSQWESPILDVADGSKLYRLQPDKDGILSVSMPSAGLPILLPESGRYDEALPVLTNSPNSLTYLHFHVKKDRTYYLSARNFSQSTNSFELIAATEPEELVEGEAPHGTIMTAQPVPAAFPWILRGDRAGTYSFQATEELDGKTLRIFSDQLAMLRTPPGGVQPNPDQTAADFIEVKLVAGQSYFLTALHSDPYEILAFIK